MVSAGRPAPVDHRRPTLAYGEWHRLPVQSLKTGFTTIFDVDTQMEFDLADQSAFAANARLRAKPGAEWRYTNCNFVLLAR